VRVGRVFRIQRPALRHPRSRQVIKSELTKSRPTRPPNPQRHRLARVIRTRRRKEFVLCKFPRLSSMFLILNRQDKKTKPPRRQDRQGSGNSSPDIKSTKNDYSPCVTSYSLGGLGVLAVLISLYALSRSGSHQGRARKKRRSSLSGMTSMPASRK